MMKWWYPEIPPSIAILQPIHSKTTLNNLLWFLKWRWLWGRGQRADNDDDDDEEDDWNYFSYILKYGWMTESEWRMVMGMGWLLDGDIGMFNTTPNALFDFNFNMIWHMTLSSFHSFINLNPFKHLYAHFWNLLMKNAELRNTERWEDRSESDEKLRGCYMRTT